MSIASTQTALKLALANPFLLMHAGAALSVLALAFRDQLKLRSILLCGILFSTAYHIVRPSWQEVPWNILTFLINAYVLVFVALDRTHVGLSREEEELFSAFGTLSPGEFRALTKLASWKTSEGQHVLTVEGEIPENLYFVLRGEIRLEKAGREFDLDPRTFIGEVAFLHGAPASATVRVETGARYLVWPVKPLQKRMEAKVQLRNAIMGLIGLDMALKVAKA